MSTQQPAKGWSYTIRHYSLDDIAKLQEWVRANPQSLITGLMCFCRDMQPTPSLDDALLLWGPMAERIFKGEDLVGEYKNKAGEQGFHIE